MKAGTPFGRHPFEFDFVEFEHGEVAVMGKVGGLPAGVVFERRGPGGGGGARGGRGGGGGGGGAPAAGASRMIRRSGPIDIAEAELAGGRLRGPDPSEEDPR